MKNLFDTVELNGYKGVIVAISKRRKWTYYDIIWDDTEVISNDWEEYGYTYQTVREDKLG